MTSAQSSRRSKIDDAVEMWHKQEPGTIAASMPLHEYLGWTWAEYCAYTAHDRLPPEREGAL